MLMATVTCIEYNEPLHAMEHGYETIYPPIFKLGFIPSIKEGKINLSLHLVVCFHNLIDRYQLVFYW
jgi:hypothetical protein